LLWRRQTKSMRKKTTQVGARRPGKSDPRCWDRPASLQLGERDAQHGAQPRQRARMRTFSLHNLAPASESSRPRLHFENDEVGQRLASRVVL
jgi:hypothetical protein